MTCWADSPFVTRPASVMTSLLCGGVSGIIGRTVTAPVSRLGILAQVEIGPKTSAKEMTRRIWAREGLRGFWRGNLATVLKIGPSVAISLTLFDFLRSRFEREHTFGRFHSSGLNHFAAGSIAGMASLTATYPLDILRTNMSLEREAASIRATLQQIGARNLFRGLGLGLVEVIPQSGLRFFLMGVLRDLFHERIASDQVSIILSAAVGGVVSQTVTSPLALIRRVQQTTNMSAWHCTKRVYKANGVRGLFRGLPLNIAQVVPGVSIGFWTYEWTKANLSPILDK